MWPFLLYLNTLERWWHQNHSWRNRSVSNGRISYRWIKTEVWMPLNEPFARVVYRIRHKFLLDCCFRFMCRRYLLCWRRSTQRDNDKAAWSFPFQLTCSLYCGWDHENILYEDWHRISQRGLTRRVFTKILDWRWHEGNGSESFLGEPFLFQLSFLLLWTLRDEGTTTAVTNKGFRHILQFPPSGYYQILEKVPICGTNILLQSNMNSDLSW